MNQSSRVVGLGEILWDILPDGARHLGGAPMNVAVHAQSLGCTSAVVSAVGDDDLGREAVRQLTQNHGLDIEGVAMLAGRPTGAVDVLLVDGQPTYQFRADVAWDFLEVTAAARRVVRSADAVVFGTLAQRSEVSRGAIRELLSTTDDHCLRVFDVNLRPPFYDEAIIRESLGDANILKLNDAELPIVLSALGASGIDDYSTRLFHDLPRLSVIALTRGESGSTLYMRDQPGGHSLPAKKINVRDTVGAGDAFTAALIAGLLSGRPIEKTHRHAAALAAFVCTRPGATPRIPDELVSI
jgi:fructokinase